MREATNCGKQGVVDSELDFLVFKINLKGNDCQQPTGTDKEHYGLLIHGGYPPPAQKMIITHTGVFAQKYTTDIMLHHGAAWFLYFA